MRCAMVITVSSANSVLTTSCGTNHQAYALDGTKRLSWMVNTYLDKLVGFKVDSRSRFVENENLAPS